MPKQLEDCVQKIKAQGKSESEAYAICGKSTGWVRSKNGWKNKKTGETYNESHEDRGIDAFGSFTEMFLESKTVNYKDIVKDFDHISSVTFIDKNGYYVQVIGDKNNEPKKELYQYKNKKVAQEVAKKVQNFVEKHS